MSVMKPSITRVRAAALLGAALLALGGCSDKPAAQFEPAGTGSVSGLLFYDADNNGQFTPVGGDTLLSGVTLQLLERGSSTQIATTTTATNGTFTFTGVPLGTHDLRVVRDTAITHDLVFCKNPMSATVYAEENRFLAVPAKLGCVISIASAEPQTGATVTVAGIVTAGQGVYRSANDNAYIQDATGGVQIFGLPASLGLVEGDSVEITGTMTVFSGETEITSPRVAANVKHGVAVPAPLVRTAAQIGGLTTTSADVGRLIRIDGVQVGAFSGTGSGRNATATQGTDTFLLRLDGNALTNIGTGYFQAGKCYDIVGVLGIFNGTSQLKPRTTADITEVPCS